MQPSNEEALIFHGLGASPGLALGPALLFQRDAAPPARAIAPEQIAAEQDRLRAATIVARDELQALSRHSTAQIGQNELDIFVAQSLMAEDPDLRDRAVALIASERVDAATAITRAGEEQAATLRALPDSTLSARAIDVLDVTARVARHLGASVPDLGALVGASDRPPVILALDLTPSDTMSIQSDQVAAIALARGGPTAHAAILARALGIPLVTGLGESFMTQARPGQLVAVDATAGLVTLDPTAATQEPYIAAAHQTRTRRAASQALARQWRTRPGATHDGQPIAILANVGNLADALSAEREWGAAGIGLLRTEFLFTDRAEMPGEMEQAELYARVFAGFADRLRPSAPVVARTLDAGADKPLAALRAIMTPEENPALGFRGLRVHLAYPDLLRAQVAGLLRAAGATSTPLHIMFPMVATLDEVILARRVVTEETERLRGVGVPLPERVPVGIMVETPAAALLADALARVADFFSVGTNDLTQYTMASDRGNPRVAALAQPTQPAVLRLIARVATAGTAAGRPVAVCGEFAGQPQGAALLVGLGVTELSMSAPLIPAVKAYLARLDLPDLRRIAAAALDQPTLAGVQRLMADSLPPE